MPIRHLSFSLALLFASTLTLNARESDIVKYRQSMMKAMGTYVSAIGAISKGNVPFRNELAAHATSLRVISQALPAWFPAGTGPDKIRSEAKGEIWSKPAEFRSAAQKLAAETARLEQAAQKGDPQTISSTLDSIKKSCAGCHDHFRLKDDE
jgi:cytochrome c556